MNGFGVMGLPFRSGHVLAMRRFAASSIGPGYTSVWHRAPDGEWVFYVDVPPWQSCPRYFGAVGADVVQTSIALDWPAPGSLRVTMPAVGFSWELSTRATAATRLMNGVGRVLPVGVWRRPGALRALASIFHECSRVLL